MNRHHKTILNKNGLIISFQMEYIHITMSEKMKKISFQRFDSSFPIDINTHTKAKFLI
jgi:hypothetical protein